MISDTRIVDRHQYNTTLLKMGLVNLGIRGISFPLLKCTLLKHKQSTHRGWLCWGLFCFLSSTTSSKNNESYSHIQYSKHSLEASHFEDELNTVCNSLPFPVFYMYTVLTDRIKIYKKVISKIMLTGLIDAFFLVYEPDSFPIKKMKKKILWLRPN